METGLPFIGVGRVSSTTFGTRSTLGSPSATADPAIRGTLKVGPTVVPERTAAAGYPHERRALGGSCQDGTDERLSEIAEILALGLMRLRSRKSSELSRDLGESSLHLLADQSGVADPNSLESAE